jgi:hypothetical protein
MHQFYATDFILPCIIILRLETREQGLVRQVRLGKEDFVPLAQRQHKQGMGTLETTPDTLKPLQLTGHM